MAAAMRLVQLRVAAAGALQECHRRQAVYCT